MPRSRRPSRRSGGRPPARALGRLDHWRADGTAKHAFPDRASADRASLAARLEHGVDVLPYRCSFCDRWHLGSER
ncbi:MAG: hypothetical protein M0029_06755 [Actinomycetota bacterium]|jgi:hypothetical protein|nr:hypothetical protein [Actinomycetota bacterium]